MGEIIPRISPAKYNRDILETQIVGCYNQKRRIQNPLRYVFGILDPSAVKAVRQYEADIDHLLDHYPHGEPRDIYALPGLVENEDELAA